MKGRWWISSVGGRVELIGGSGVSAREREGGGKGSWASGVRWADWAVWRKDREMAGPKKRESQFGPREKRERLGEGKV